MVPASAIGHRRSVIGYRRSVIAIGDRSSPSAIGPRRSLIDHRSSVLGHPSAQYKMHSEKICVLSSQ
jgi:hypothetical protein